MAQLNSYFGQFGGMYVPQILIPALIELENIFLEANKDPMFHKQLNTLLTEYAGRPTPLTLCTNLTLGTCTKLYLKREDLLHGGAHKINQVIGQMLLAKRMGKKNIIAETGAGQHGVATAMVASVLGLTCRIYMGTKDIERQKSNVYRMELMGAKVIPVSHGSSTLKDACNEAMRDWSTNYNNTHYVIGTSAGPHPFPTIVGKFQSIIGEETYKQLQKKEKSLPNIIVACVGGGSNAIGIFTKFINQPTVKLIGVEAGGIGNEKGQNSAAMNHGTTGIYFGMKSLIIQSQNGQISDSYSISAGLDFPSVGPQHAFLQHIGRAKYVSITDDEAIIAFKMLSKKEGIIPALESSHALAYILKIIENNPKQKQIIVMNLSGRGDKDISTICN